MKSKVQSFLLFLFVLALSDVYSQDKVTLSGTIANKSNSEKLIDVNIYIPEAKAYVVTNSKGFYSITLPIGYYTMIISYMGFDNIEEHFYLAGNTKKHFKMLESTTTLKKVVVKDKKTKTN